MKRIITFICYLFSLFLFVSCNNKENISSTPSTSVVNNNSLQNNTNSNVLVAFFSRPGENWQVGILFRNTEIFKNNIINYTGFDVKSTHHFW